MSKTQFHRNLNKGCWSYIPPGGKTLHCDHACLSDVDVRHPSLKNKQFKACLAGGSRKVFAWFKARTVTPCPWDTARKARQAHPEAERIYFDPTKGDKYFHVIRGSVKYAVYTLSILYAVGDSTYGVVTGKVVPVDQLP